MRRINHWIGGSEWELEPERTGPVFNPANGSITAEVSFASSDLVEHAASVAREAFGAWKGQSLARRAQVLFNFREILNLRKLELAELITDEHGKVLEDALAEVSRGQEVVEFACGIPHLLKGSYSPSASTGINVHSLRQPVGAVGVISPFNFPAMVPMWFYSLAIASGNTVVLKPSEKDPSTSNLVAQMWNDAGLPPGVFNVVHGDKESVDALLDSPSINAVSFVGSTPIARYVYQRGTAMGKRVQALGGAKNHMLVMDDADLDFAADQAVNAGFGSAGERCMAISVVLAVDSIADSLVSRIASRLMAIRTGDGRRGCDMGPLVTKAHRDKVASYIDAGISEGATLVVDGRTVIPDGDPGGFWLGPTLLDHVQPPMSVYQDEIFGPVLSVIRVSGLDDGLQLINDHAYGNGTAIFTASGAAARRFEEEVEVGMVGVNVPVPVPVSYYSFGGWKGSLFGDLHAHGMEGVQFFTKGKVVTSRWTEAKREGIDLGFPTQS